MSWLPVVITLVICAAAVVLVVHVLNWVASFLNSLVDALEDIKAIRKKLEETDV